MIEESAASKPLETSQHHRRRCVLRITGRVDMNTDEWQHLHIAAVRYLDVILELSLIPRQHENAWRTSSTTCHQGQ